MTQTIEQKITLCDRDLTAIADQTNHKIFFERLASQAFQKISWFGFERKVL